MNEYLKEYIELQKQFRETKGNPDSVRALYTFKEKLELSEDKQAKEVLVDVYDLLDFKKDAYELLCQIGNRSDKKTLKRLGTLKEYAENWGNHYALPKPKTLEEKQKEKERQARLGLPTFRYHPNPLETGAFEESADGVACDCCGKTTHIFYTGPFYAVEDIECLCPECISSGEAARKYDGSFQDDCSVDDGVEDPARLDELIHRTPGYSGWQQEYWRAHCGDYCAYLGHVGARELRALGVLEDEMGYRRSFWTHRPLTDFWRVGKGYAAKLEAHGLYTMGDIARCSIGQPTDYHNEELLYKLFGVNAELLIDHAWGWEPCTIADIKAYKPENKSIVSGQILQYPYPFEKARLVIQEMADALALELVDKRLATNQLVLTVGYDIENLKGTAYTGEITTDHYGRKIPKHAHGTVNLDGYTSSGEELLKAATSLYDRIVDKTLLARRLTLCANHLLDESSVPEDLPEQIDLFTDYSAKEKQKKEADTAHARERKLQKTMLGIKKRFGKNAILKGLNLEDGATARERNNQIGGHKA